MTRSRPVRLAVHALEARDNPSGGLLDTTFNGTGQEAFPSATLQNVVAVAAQPDGKILAAGYAFTKSGSEVRQLVRTNPDGTLDTTFNGSGVATVSAYGNGFWDAVAVQPDGKIVVGGLGTVARNMGTGYVVARYNPNGTLDTAFGDPAKNGRTGVWTYDPSSKDERLQALGVVTDSSNRVTGIMVEGRGFDPSGQSAFAAIKLTPAGALDPAYGTNGTALLTFGGRPSTPYGMAVTPNGGVVLVGDPGQPAGGIAVLTPAGQLDTSFNGTGYRTDTAAGVTAPYTAYQDVAVQPVGTGYRYVVVGDAHYGTYNRGIVTAYTSAGQVDTTFATNGLYVTPDTGGFSGGAPTADGNLMHVAVAPDGSIVVAGYVSIINPDGSTWSEGVVTHLLADGTVDTAFGPTGEGLATFTNGPDIRALAVDASGRPVFGGENSSRQGWLVRLTAA